MKKISSLLFLLPVLFGNAQLLNSSPDFPRETDVNAVITMDATKGNQGLKDYNPDDVYVHIGCITNFSTSPTDWKYSKFTWGTTDANAKAVSLGGNKWTYTLIGANMRAFYGITNAAEKILKVVILFRSGNGSRAQRNTDGSDMYVPVYDATLQTRITNPLRQPTYIPSPEPINKSVGDLISIEAKSTETSNLKLFFNGVQVNSLNSTSITANPTITMAGSQRIIAEAELGGTTRRDTIDFLALTPTVIAALPAGVVDGINYDAGNTSVTLVLYAPNKFRAVVIGDFNNWTENSNYQMKQTPDGSRLWLQITGLTPGTEYAYQYIIDGTLKLADYNAEKILDPNNDQYITSTTYPGLKPYPTGLTTGNVSVFQTNKPAYTWSSGTFSRPDKRSMSMYELHLRDFLANHDWKTLIDTLTYLKRLGINAIHVMPFNEFEGNSSWGYNTSFYFAPDKYYGTENELRRFVDSAHKKGMAVIMDLVLNHSYGQSPMVQMYWDAANSRPAANSPWFNPVAPHSWLTFGFDFNHEAQPTKDFTDRVIDHWLTKYKIDGIRWDFTKGFSQRNAPTEPASAAYDAGRIATLKRIYDRMQAASPGSICILEHFCANSEEIELSNYGMLLWANMNYNYNEASMGWVTTSNFQGVIHTQRGWNQPTLLGYAESHDEERLMYKNILYGNSTQAPTYDIKNTVTALKRQEMVAAFLIPVPGPKLIWQFGELGYDYSINRCENGTINDNCRTSPKPIVWNYYQDANRKALFDVYAKLNKLKTAPVYSSTFTGNDISFDLGGAIKWIKINGAALKVLVVGNFDVQTQTSTISFQQPGTWYSYLTGTTRNATGASESITLQPGEYYVYTSVNAEEALPLQILSFAGRRNTNSIDLNWYSTKEVNVKGFDIERSFDGSTFTGIGSLQAQATNASQSVKYVFADKDELALKTRGLLYYRLKMNDKDGRFSYSNIITVSPSGMNPGVLIYPNPVKGDKIFIKMANRLPVSAVSVKIQDAGGRTWSSFSMNGAGYSNSPIPINIQSLASGMYLLKVETLSGTFTKTFVVQQ